MPIFYSSARLVEFANSLLECSGLEGDKARSVAEVLVEGDLLGHSTHGLALLAGYLADRENGAMANTKFP